MPLAAEHAQRISKDTPPLMSGEIADLVREVPGWTVDEKSIERTFDFPDFARAMEFALKVGELAEREDHHPELCVSWGQTRVVFSTHKIDGLSRNDFILAAKVDQLAGANQA